MTTNKCMNPSCTNSEVHRGLCTGCYQAARKLVKAGKITWEALVANGKCKEGHMDNPKIEWFLS